MKTDKCFVIMPISDIEGYNKGHFTDVYTSLIKPAIEKAGYQSERADEIQGANLIAVDIIERICSSPIAVCDMSACNPNVFYELGIRHAMKLPVILIKDNKTKSPFDIKDIRYIEYSEQLPYSEVVEKQNELAFKIKQTIEEYRNGISKNSLFHILKPDGIKYRIDEQCENYSLMEQEAHEILSMIGNQKYDLTSSMEIEKLILAFSNSYSNNVKGIYYSELLKTKFKQTSLLSFWIK